MSAMRWFTSYLPAASGSWGAFFFACWTRWVVALGAVSAFAQATQPLASAPGETSQARAAPITRDARPPASRFVTVNLIANESPIEQPAVLAARQRSFALKCAMASIEIYPVRVGRRVDSAIAAGIARQLVASGIGDLCGVAAPLLLAAPDPLGCAAPWLLAREFSSRLRARASDADYALYAAYDIDPVIGERITVDLILCTAGGDLVVVDRVAASEPDFRDVQAARIENCTELLLIRLREYVSRAPTDSSSQSVDARRTSAMAKNLSP